MLENYSKYLILQYCERSELCFVFSACHLSECVQFVIVLQRDRNMGRVNESTGYGRSKAGISRFFANYYFLGIFGSTLWETWDL